MKITLPKPCQENWETMTSQKKGRFCAACSKTVRDFTKDSDDEILDFFSDSSSQNVCGNFYESQLNRNMQYSFINSLFSKFAIGFILTTSGIVSTNAQENDSVKKTVFSSLQEQIICLSGAPENTILRPSTRGMPSSVQGSNEPLWVVDGIIADAKTVKDLNPKKIKNMEIIRGTSAVAIYGKDGNNGVIVVTTKKGFRKKN
ncbi:MAG: TonB-dependent receptor plug domain-containing protein [Chryseobacterium sp.]|uniref:TonB-dependent receptor plug domain-containing protein n=1 Tax=Chryseobacterium sp. TaxID=1871047 RepID=UPI001B013A6C|nr:TonB-dependent receptor plug domain-containing protein [Chryseobacterium sp.]MBO6185826.1 TonB-dependent receptor plug domain-containing protein [Chryseobacterium sp.]